MAALELLRGAEAEITEVFGRKLRLRHAGQGAGDAEQGVYTRERSRSRDRRGGSGVVWVTLFVDELSMPGRPQLEPFHTTVRFGSTRSWTRAAAISGWRSSARSRRCSASPTSTTLARRATAAT
ncbi:unnamed protein product [Prorocentrum cordatum]|uniref:Uncharacterized protein n=1 Tax=Prorocentrum cordatum TaxID=2364126 RepID=A0ABN9RYH2_9DINO|nr:unnamed protein product [Polarella glacialis]